MSRIATILNTLLKPTGFSATARARTIPELQNQPQLASAGRIIEFVGAQGIGKSTLSNAVHSRLKERWFFRADLGDVGPATASFPGVEQAHRKLYFDRINWLQEHQPDAWHSFTAARQMARVISESLMLSTVGLPRGFVLDEGLFKNFPQEILNHAEALPDEIWKGRALIHLRAKDPQSVVNRYQKRVAERDSKGLMLRAPSDADILERTKKDTALFENLLEIAENRGCSTLVIDAETSHDENVNKVLDFESDLLCVSLAAVS